MSHIVNQDKLAMKNILIKKKEIKNPDLMLENIIQHDIYSTTKQYLKNMYNLAYADQWYKFGQTMKKYFFSTEKYCNQLKELYQPCKDVFKYEIIKIVK